VAFSSAGVVAVVASPSFLSVRNKGAPFRVTVACRGAQAVILNNRISNRMEIALVFISSFFWVVKMDYNN
jgi:hypothetical protein